MSPSSITWNSLSFGILKSTCTIIFVTALVWAIEYYIKMVMPIAMPAIYTVKNRLNKGLVNIGKLVPLTENQTYADFARPYNRKKNLT